MNRTGKNLRFWILLTVTLSTAAACASIQGGYHAHVMQGQIIDKRDGYVVLGIGTEEGARVGQVLTVYEGRNVPIAGNPKAVRYERVPVGKIRITEIIDGHFSRAQIIEGSADKYNFAELRTGR